MRETTNKNNSHKEKCLKVKAGLRKGKSKVFESFNMKTSRFVK